MMRKLIPSLVIIPLILCSAAAYAEDAKHNNVDKDRVILKGYDPVSYFTSGKPQLGDAKITTEYEGAVYRFASDENRQKFLAEPKKYLPEYGGWCAKALADKNFVDIDPLNFKITNGRLFLFYKGLLGDALPIWNKDEANLTQRADKNWQEITSK
jgi:YHS domain-containing protein